jgi:hypothetical protein
LLYTESQRQANQHVVTQRVDGVNALRAKNARQADGIKSLKAQLATAKAKNHRTDETIFGKFLFQESLLEFGDLAKMISKLTHASCQFHCPANPLMTEVRCPKTWRLVYPRCTRVRGDQ